MGSDLMGNYILLAGLTAWVLAQLLKIPTHYLVNHEWNFGLIFTSGGMPSSHTALMTCITLSIGLYDGFGTPLFALAFAISMIVIYDAAGVRRQAGIHAQRINVLVRELLSGHPVSQDLLKEVIGHTPQQVIGGIILGTVVALIYWLLLS
ncbi:MAG: divergent PAP2 family protein [Anaerolineales bacterium]